MERWAGKTALVTGASSGIGAAVAHALVAAGMRVSALARRRDRLDDLEKATDGAVLGFCADLRDEKQILDAFAKTRDAFGGVDVLINNAGLGHNSSLMTGDTQAWREMLEVNVLALCVCTREAIADMRQRGDRGHVIHIGSMSGYRVAKGGGVYSASKFAVRALTEGLRQELRELHSNIRVSAVSPGFVETEFAQKYHRSVDAARETYGRYPVLQPAQIASTVVHILSQPEHAEIHDVLLRPTAQVS